ncbi:MAG: RlmE family RNA methyltransferase [Alphaproteobacteria bacterium]|nr:RlmE family RNA methyltransferase [Alphaproteobacteria bacterium]MCB1839564.1 RlmE family RNA methyltransferase [Alphaproteobacteria bacterium]
MTRNKPKTRVKTAKKRKSSSTRWLQRQLNDPYVEQAQKKGYRGRAAFKLKEIDEKAGILKSGMVVVDLGAAPGGWCQIALEKKCKVVAIDLLEIDELPGVVFFQKDFMEDDAPELLKAEISKLNESGLADVVLSDMAPNTIGHKQTDHLRIMAVVEAAYLFATEVLRPGGAFVAKVFQGGAEDTLLKDMKKRFEKVKHIKPPASRKDSSEQYVVATGFKG